ncbi:MAG: ABC transporter transmembrane domain-containing protein [Dehalococcoidia bacterium]
MTAVADLTCPSCGRQNPRDALFCAGCATPLVCTGCQAQLAQGATYCTRCGRAAGRRLDANRLDVSLNRPVERRIHRTPHLRIHVQIGSFADQQAVVAGQRLEALLAVLSGLLGVAPGDRPIALYLGEVLQDPAQPGRTLTAGSYAVPEHREIWSVYRSDAPGVDLERTFVRLLLMLHTGADPALAPLLLDGVVGAASQQLGFLPPASELAQMLAGAHASGAPVAVRPLLGGASAETAQLYPAVAASFVGQLLTERGPEPFLKLLRGYDSKNPDAAARSAYGQTFAGLEKRWFQYLKKATPTAGGIGKFLKSSLTYLRPYRMKQAEIILYILFYIAFSQALPLAQRYLIDNALFRKQTHTLVVMLAVGLLLFFIMGAAQLRQSFLGAEVGEGVMKDLREQMYVRLQELSAGFYSVTPTGDILSRMSNDLFAVEYALTGALLQGLVLVLTFFASLGSLLYIDWKLTLIALAILPLFYLITRFLGPPASKAALDRQEQLAVVTGSLQENISAQSVVRAYGLQQTFIREWLAQTARLYHSAIRLNFLGSMFGLSASLLTTLIQLLAFGIGGYFVIQGNLTLGALVAFLSLLGGLIAPAQSLSGVAQALQQASGAMDRIRALIEAKPSVADQPGATAMGALREGIRFERVTFSYTGAEPQINEVSFTIPAGTSVAFVGPSGSGKSTVANLIMRFYDAGSGAVQMDSIDVRELTVDSLRRQIGLVAQDNFLFNRSIRENIRFGREDASDAEVEAAAKAAEVHEFITELPQGYDTPVGERGANLSGGQRQRISIARAILRNPSILILDEATSALDPRTENAINHTLASLARGRTTISITHRLSAAATADRIYVLDRGRLAEEGTHHELLQAGGLYARLYEEQSGAVTGGVLKLALESEYLRRVPIFASLDGDVLATVASRLTTERFATGDDIVREGELGDKLYLLVAGEADVLAKDATGSERPFAVLRAGDYFGEIALMYDVPRTATVRVRTPASVYALDRDSFLALLEAVPGLRQTVEQTISQREAGNVGVAAAVAAARQAPTGRTTAGAASDSGPVLIERPEQAAASLFIAPWTRRRPRLVVVEGDNAGASYALNEQHTGIGRHPSNDIVLADRRVSGYHARIERDTQGGFRLVDSGSTNGTRVDGQTLSQPATLRDGSVIQLGRTSLRFERGGIAP